MSLLGHDPWAVWGHMKAGFIVSGAVKTATAPLDRAKLLLQTQQCLYGVHSGEVPRYSGVVDCLTRMVREQGPLSLWRGNWPTLLRYVPLFGFNFYFQAYFKQIFLGYNRNLHPLAELSVKVAHGAASGAAALLVLHPFDVIRTRMACDLGRGYTREYRGALDCIARSAHLVGLFNISFVAYGVSVLAVMVHRGLYFGLYDYYLPMCESESKAQRFALAQLTTLAAGYVAYPLDTVRRRLMLQPGSRQRMYCRRHSRLLRRCSGTLSAPSAA
eukprot:TRINITY_DN21918_c0_g1_i2.p2 TRINITY_DN21918_c0_g1~~TRINITY_DN21918_c0_g1_i2.p2  ORF type:complete len:272 (+),score=61.48 TRINITY_DN21918_c0_g1_i2:73-888(+)